MPHTTLAVEPGGLRAPMAHPKPCRPCKWLPRRKAGIAGGRPLARTNIWSDGHRGEHPAPGPSNESRVGTRPLRSDWPHLGVVPNFSFSRKRKIGYHPQDSQFWRQSANPILRWRRCRLQPIPSRRKLPPPQLASTAGGAMTPKPQGKLKRVFCKL